MQIADGLLIFSGLDVQIGQGDADHYVACGIEGAYRYLFQFGYRLLSPAQTAVIHAPAEAGEFLQQLAEQFLGGPAKQVRRNQERQASGCARY